MLLLAMLAARSGPLLAQFDHSHRTYGELLSRFVVGPRVDYKGLRKDRNNLDLYLQLSSEVTEPEFLRWNEAQQMVYLINLYNARTLALILDYYPIKSINHIGGLMRGPWRLNVVPLFGEMLTLDQLEHEILRKKYHEPRIHFALVCAAKGCPPLREEPYMAENLEEQLQDQGVRFFAESEKNRVDSAAGVVYLSPIFKWFKNDFTRDGKTVLAFVTPYFDERSQSVIKANKEMRLKFTYYDWALNST